MSIKGLVSFIIGTFAGALAGAALGLLFAPDSGEASRGLIRDQVQTTSGQFARTFEDRIAALRSLGPGNVGVVSSDPTIEPVVIEVIVPE